MIILLTTPYALLFLLRLSLKCQTNQPFPFEQLLLKASLLFQQRHALQAKSIIVSLIPYSCDSIYNIPSTFRKTGAGIGYGKKSDFTKDLTFSPGSSKYDIKTIFDRNKSSSKGFSLYVSRDVPISFTKKIPDKGHIALDPLKVPGPDKYDTNKYDNLKLSRAPTFTMRRKLPVIDRTMSI